jgi:hypothetical protein
MWDRLPAGLRSVVLLLALAGVAVCAHFFRTEYRVESSPPGVFQLEVAGTARDAWYVLSTFEGVLMHQASGPRPWVMFNPSIQGNGYRRAYDNVRFDFAFIPCYALALWLGCAWTASRFRAINQPGPARLGEIAALLQPLAAVCDGIENIGILKMLGQFHQQVTAAALDPAKSIRPEAMDPWPLVTAIAAWAKWAFVAVGAIIFAAGLVLAIGQWVEGRIRRDPPRILTWGLPALGALGFAALAGYALTRLQVIEPLPLPPEPRSVQHAAPPAPGSFV